MTEDVRSDYLKTDSSISVGITEGQPDGSILISPPYDPYDPLKGNFTSEKIVKVRSFNKVHGEAERAEIIKGMLDNEPDSFFEKYR